MTLNIGIVGATGYVGEELASIIESRKDLSLAFVSSFSHEGKKYKEIYSKTNSKLVLQPIDQMPKNLDYVFLFRLNYKIAPLIVNLLLLTQASYKNSNLACLNYHHGMSILVFHYILLF